MIKNHRTLLMLSLLLGSQAMVGTAAVRAGELTLNNTTDYKGQSLGDGRFERSKLVFTADARVGYDDNTLARPDRVTTTVIDPVTLQVRKVTTDLDQADSAFLNFDFGVGYTASTPRATLSLGGDVGVNYFFDRPGRDYDVNGSGRLAFTYKITPQALLSITSYNAYTSEADFGASNGTNFNGNGLNGFSNANGVTAADNQNGDFFYTSNRLALSYQWTQRFSTVTGYNLTALAYREEPYITIQDRAEHYFSQEFRFLLSPTLTAVAEYRFGYVDYFGVSNDSFLHYGLVGADYTLSRRLRAGFRVGVQSRDYLDYDSNNGLSPYVEANLNYDLSRQAHLGFVARYSNEEGDITSTNSDTDTLRLGVSYEQQFGGRLSGYLSFYYTHADYGGADTFLVDTTGKDFLLNGNRVVVYPGSFTENTFDMSVGMRYSVNRLISAEVGYTHTTVLSGIDLREYDRNRYFGGVRFSF